MAKEEPTLRREAADRAAAQLGLEGDAADRLRNAVRNAAARELAEIAAAKLEGSVREALARDRVIDAVIHSLAARGARDPAFLEIAGFGRPLPEWADWLPVDADDEALFWHDLAKRIAEIRAALKKTSDRQLAEERFGASVYRPVEQLAY